MSQKLNSEVAVRVIGIDIGKNSLHIVGQDRRGALVLRQKWACPGFVDRRGLGIRVSGLTAFCPPLGGNLLVRPRASFREWEANAPLREAMAIKRERWRVLRAKRAAK
jgi:hypothetical protein